MPTVKVEGDEIVQVRPGEEVTLEVTGSGATGYLWQLEANPDAVEVTGHEVIPNENSFGAPGWSGSPCVRFVKAMPPCSSSLRRLGKPTLRKAIPCAFTRPLLRTKVARKPMR